MSSKTPGLKVSGFILSEDVSLAYRLTSNTTHVFVVFITLTRDHRSASHISIHVSTCTV